MNYSKLASEIRKQKTRTILLESPLAKILGQALKKEKVKFKIVKTLQEAVKLSSQNATKSEIVLLSPAAAWFCYFTGKIPLGGRGFEQFAKTLV
jgi:UDP-N-acetylmuramoylalanine-D-glutamate ligase